MRREDALSLAKSSPALALASSDGAAFNIPGELENDGAEVASQL
jgi:hypothetical protein